MDNSGILYFGILSPPSIFCWNSRTQFIDDNFYRISVNRITLQFSSGMKIVNGKHGPELWVLTSSYQKFATNSLSNITYNFRILQGDIPALLKGSLCRRS